MHLWLYSSDRRYLLWSAPVMPIWNLVRPTTCPRHLKTEILKNILPNGHLFETYRHRVRFIARARVRVSVKFRNLHISISDKWSFGQVTCNHFICQARTWGPHKEVWGKGHSTLAESGGRRVTAANMYLGEFNSVLYFLKTTEAKVKVKAQWKTFKIKDNFTTHFLKYW